MQVLLADDHAIVRAGLKQILVKHAGVNKVFEAGDGGRALQIIKEENIDLVLLDISMPKLSGLEVLTEARKLKCDAKFLILSMYPERQYAIRAIKNGAAGYITKDSAADELHLAIDAVLAGRKYVSKNLQNIIFEKEIDNKTSTPHERLSDQEFKVFLLLAKGISNWKIAEQLFISTKTVSTYKSRIFEKMHFNSVQDLTKYAIQYKLID